MKFCTSGILYFNITPILRCFLACSYVYVNACHMLCLLCLRKDVSQIKAKGLTGWAQSQTRYLTPVSQSLFSSEKVADLACFWKMYLRTTYTISCVISVRRPSLSLNKVILLITRSHYFNFLKPNMFKMGIEFIGQFLSCPYINHRQGSLCLYCFLLGIRQIQWLGR